MKFMNSNDYLTREVLSERKRFSEYMFLKNFCRTALMSLSKEAQPMTNPEISLEYS